MATGKGKGKKGKSASKKTVKAPKKNAARVAGAKKAQKTKEEKKQRRSRAAKKAAKTRAANLQQKTAKKPKKKKAKKAAAKTKTAPKAAARSTKPKKKKAKKAAAKTAARSAPRKSPKKSGGKKSGSKKKTAKTTGRRPKKKVNVSIPGYRVVGGKPQTTNVRLTISREALAAKGKGGKKKRPKKRPSAGEGTALYESGGGMVMENPMSGTEFLVSGVAVGVGVFLSDFTNRFVMTMGAAKAYAHQGTGDNSDGPPATASTKGSWLGYGDAVNAPPNAWAMLAQGGLVVASVGGAWFFDNRYVRAGFQGLALGVIGNVVKHLAVDYVLVKWFGVDKATGSPRPLIQRLYPDEFTASLVKPNLLSASSSSSTGTSGVPQNAAAPQGQQPPTGLGRNAARPYGTRFFKDPGPHAGVGNTVVPRGGDAPAPVPTPPTPRGGDQPPSPPVIVVAPPPALDVGTPPMGGGGGCGGPPCSTQSYGQQAADAYQEGIQDASCGCDSGMGKVPEPVAVPAAPPAAARPAARTQTAPPPTGLGRLGLPAGPPLFWDAAE